MDYQAAVNVVSQSGVKAFVIGTPAGELHKRLFVGGGRLAEYKPRSSRRGCVLDERDVDRWDFVRPVPKKDTAVEWERTLRRAHGLLAASGFWPDIKANIEAALEIGYAKVQQAYNVEWDNRGDFSEGYDEREKNKRAAIAAIDPRLNNTEIRWHLNAPLKIKAIYFGRWENAAKKAQVCQLVETKTKGTVYGKSSYDVHYSFTPADGTSPAKAWWSEEYRGCGNGHYYLALDAEHAVFWEDD